MTIDMKSVPGEKEVPAAVVPEVNSYKDETQGETYGQLPVDATNPVQSEPVQQAAPPVEDAQTQNFRALSESVEKLKAERDAERKDYQLQLDMLRANIARSGETNAPQKQLFDGMQDDEIPNVADLRKAWGEREAAYNEQLAEMHVQRTYPDYAEVLEKYGKTLAQTDPLFIQGIRSADNKALFAYQYAKREQRFRSLEDTVRGNPVPQQSQVVSNAQRMVENARKPATLAQAGGQSLLSKADYYATMSDREFHELVSKNMGTV